jgi:hypothetical protein
MTRQEELVALYEQAERYKRVYDILRLLADQHALLKTAGVSDALASAVVCKTIDALGCALGVS